MISSWDISTASPWFLYVLKAVAFSDSYNLIVTFILWFSEKSSRIYSSLYSCSMLPKIWSKSPVVLLLKFYLIIIFISMADNDETTISKSSRLALLKVINLRNLNIG